MSKTTRFLLFALLLSGIAVTGPAFGGAALPQLDKITAADGDGDDNFGYSLAVVGNTMVIGAWQDDDLRLNSGAVYVFDRANGGNNWNLVIKLLPDNADFAGDEFGRAVDFDGNRIIVGARFDDDLATDRGAVYIFERNAGVGAAWIQADKLTSADVGFRDEFGRAVAISGDRAVVGADNESIYVFERNPANGIWTQTPALSASDGDPNDDFGQSVDISDDTVIVGASEHDHQGVGGTGAAYVFHRNSANGIWSEVDKLTADDADENDQFGFAVAILGDRVIVGAPFDDDAGTTGGSAYVFQRDAGANTFSQDDKLTAANPTLGDQFGHSVALAGERALVGAINDDDQAEDAGAAYLFVQTGGTWNSSAKLTAADGAAMDEFGFAVSLSDEVAAVGAPEADNNDIDESGSVYVFELPGDEIFSDDFES